MAGSSNAAEAARIEELEYIQTSNVNVSNFVTVKLSGPYNYEIWKAQMLCLMESHRLCGIILCENHQLVAKSVEIIERYKRLVKGWIFGLLDHEILKHVIQDTCPRVIWKQLEKLCEANLSKEIPLSIGEEILIEVPEDGSNSNHANLKRKLRLVTSEGPWWKAKAILKTHQDAATMVKIHNDDTMLHLAIREGKNYFVKNLLNFIEDVEQIEKQNSFGQTALHIAVIADNKYAAELLVKKRKELLGIPDKQSHQPLQVAYDEKKLNTFLYLYEVTKRHPKYFPSNLDLQAHILTNALGMKQYDLVLKLFKIDKVILDLATGNDEVLMTLATNFPSELGFWESLIYPSSKSVHQRIVKRSYVLLSSFDFLYKKAEDIFWSMRCCKKKCYSYLLPEIVLILLVPVAVCYIIYQWFRFVILILVFPYFILYPYLWMVLAFVVPPIKRIEKKKNIYKEAKEILKLVCDEINDNKVSCGDYNPFYRRPVMEAARVDAWEVVAQILHVSKRAMSWINDDWHNLFQVAIINRSKKVYNLLSPKIKRSGHFRTMRDACGNNLVHLAGGLAPSFVLSRTRGAALQLQRELQWHEEVRKLMFPTELIFENMKKETSEMIFTREHADLLKEGEQWIKVTAESCSITAALIVTIVFAAAITVPGGNNETGIPLFKKEIAFTIFAISDALSLFTAASALLVFLSILTTRFSEKDFLFSLPTRLFFGLCTLIISTIAMMVEFGAVLFLVFCGHRMWLLIPIGVFGCLPISVIVTLQIPLVADLYLSTYVPIFGQKVKAY